MVGSNFWMGLAIGLVIQQVVFFMPPGLAALFTWIGGRPKRRRKSWVIDGIKFTSRPLTRTVMENVNAIHADVPSIPALGVPPFIAQAMGMVQDEDELRALTTQQQQAALDSTFKTLQFMLMDENGDSPEMAFLEEHLTIQDASEIALELFT